MYSSDYIILRARRMRPSGGLFGAGTAALDASSAVADPRLEVAALGRAELADAGRDPQILAIAPVMPVRCIAPLDPVAQADAGHDALTWGVEAVGAGTSPYRGEGVTVAVLDTGIDAAHEAFRGVDVVQRDFTGEGDGDGNGHGTHCAGTILGRGSRPRIGVAPGVGRALIGKVLDSRGAGTSERIYRAILWAVDEGAQVVSMSLGFAFPALVERLVESGWPVDLATSAALEGYRANVRLFDSLAAVVRAGSAFGRDALLLAAAGNDSRRNVDPRHEIATAPPAEADGIVAVGAVQSRGAPHDDLAIAYFSNSGPDVCAPGVAVHSAWPGGGYRKLSGTSMATPHAAGIAALWGEWLLERHGSIRAPDLASLLIGRASTDRLGAGAERLDTGMGLVQAPRG